MSDDDFTSEDLKKMGEAIGKQYQIERETCGARAPHGDIEYKGVILSSRYNVQHEYNHMQRVIDALPELMARRLDSIWCDSVACATYTVMANPRLYAPELPWSVRDAFKETGGYNGITIYGDTGQSKDFDPWWPECELEEFDGPPRPASGRAPS